MVSSAWNANVKGNDGLYRAALLNELTGFTAGQKHPGVAIAQSDFCRHGVFSKSELANERIAVAVLTPSEEDEHSCFSDNTHRDIALNYQGFKNVLLGEYKGKKVGPAFFDKVPAEEQAKIKS